MANRFVAFSIRTISFPSKPNSSRPTAPEGAQAGASTSPPTPGRPALSAIDDIVNTLSITQNSRIVIERGLVMPWKIRTSLCALAATAVVGCETLPAPPPDVLLVQEGERIFFEETFSGNGRTCGTCHRAEDNFGLSPAFIASLGPDDALFVSETNPDLANNFENTRLIREFAMILENQDGFDDLANNFNMRGVPHTLALRTSIDSAAGPQTGWSGDGSPGDGSLRSFAVGAVIQHYPKTTKRVAGVDFRLPTDSELDALEAFQLSLGRQEELALPLPLKGIVATRGQEIFIDRTQGKCNACHFNAGANGDPDIFGPTAGNLNFNTGVEDLPDQPADLSGELVPPDDGLGSPGTGEFNTTVLVEAADTGPFFHNNSVETIEGAVAFYNGDAFNNSPAGALLVGATGSGINLDATQVVAVAAFLRVINSLENIRESAGLLDSAYPDYRLTESQRTNLIRRAGFEIEDAHQVLTGAGLHPIAAAHLEEAQALVERAQGSSGQNAKRLVDDAAAELKRARVRMVD
jgi:mono/diheme cytochrome c family protein